MGRTKGIPTPRISGDSEHLALTVNPRCPWRQQSIVVGGKHAKRSAQKPRTSWWLDTPPKGFTRRAQKEIEGAHS